MRHHVTTAEAEGFQIKYFKTVRQSVESESKIFHGIYVCKCRDGHVIEEADSGPITEESAQIHNIIATLAQNTVTPMTLYEVLDDMEM